MSSGTRELIEPAVVVPPARERIGLTDRWRALCARVPDLEAARAPAWSWWLVPIAMFAFGLPWLTGALTGNLSIPHSDGWAFSRIAAEFARTGQIHMLNWGPMSLVGLIAMLGPLGRWLFVQQTAISLLAVLSLYCVYDLLRFELDRRQALLATATFACWPGLAVLSTEFLTDVPALAASLGCLALAGHAYRRDSRALLGLSLVVGLWALSIRQQTLAAPIAVLAYGLATAPRRRLLNGRWLSALAAGFALATVTLLMLVASIPDRQPVESALSIHGARAGLYPQAAFAYFTIALGILPVLLAGARPRQWSRAGQLLAILSVAGAGLVFKDQGKFLLGNFFTFQGSHPSDSQPLLFGATIIDLTNIAIVIGTALLTGTLASRRARTSPLLAAFTALSFAILLATALVNHPLFDRYLLPLIPWLVVIALKSPGPATATGGPATRSMGQRRGLLVGLTLTALATISAAIFLQTFAIDRAHWHEAERLVASGFAARRIDAGIWDGWVSPHGMAYGEPSNGFLVYGRFEASAPCLVLEDEPLRRVGVVPAWLDLDLVHYPRHPRPWTLDSTLAYRTFLVAGSSRIYVYSTHAAGCPPA